MGAGRPYVIRYVVRRRYGRTIENPWDLIIVDDAVEPATERSTGYYATFGEASNAAPNDAPLAIEVQIR